MSKRVLRLAQFLFLFIFLSDCAHKSAVSGIYVGLYELALGTDVSCHFLMKKDESLPSVLCHNELQAWVVPLAEFKNQLWIAAPVLTQSGTVLAFLSEENATKVEVVASTDKGKTWDVYPSFVKKIPEDRFEGISVSKQGRLVASFENKASGKKYDVSQEAAFKSKFTAINKIAKSYPEECLVQYKASRGAKIPSSCLSGYVGRLLNQ